MRKHLLIFFGASFMSLSAAAQTTTQPVEENTTCTQGQPACLLDGIGISYAPKTDQYGLNFGIGLHKYFVAPVELYFNKSYGGFGGIAGIGAQGRVSVLSNFLLHAQAYPFMSVGTADGSGCDFTYGVKARVGAGMKLAQTRHSDLYATLDYVVTASDIFKSTEASTHDHWAFGITYIPDAHKIDAIAPGNRQSLKHDYELALGSLGSQINFRTGFGLNEYLVVPLDVAYSNVGRGRLDVLVGLGAQLRQRLGSDFLLQGRIYPYAGVCSNAGINPKTFYGAVARAGIGVKMWGNSKCDTYFMLNYDVHTDKFKSVVTPTSRNWSVGINCVPKHDGDGGTGESQKQSYDISALYAHNAKVYGVLGSIGLSKHIVMPLQLSYATPDGGTFKGLIGCGAQAYLGYGSPFILHGRVYPFVGFGPSHETTPSFSIGAAASAGAGVKIAKSAKRHTYLTLNYMITTDSEFKTTDTFKNGNVLLGLTFIPR